MGLLLVTRAVELQDLSRSKQSATEGQGCIPVLCMYVVFSVFAFSEFCIVLVPCDVFVKLF